MFGLLLPWPDTFRTLESRLTTMIGLSHNSNRIHRHPNTTFLYLWPDSIPLLAHHGPSHRSHCCSTLHCIDAWRCTCRCSTDCFSDDFCGLLCIPVGPRRLLPHEVVSCPSISHYGVCTNLTAGSTKAMRPHRRVLQSAISSTT